MDSIKSSESEPVKRRGNPNPNWKPGVSGNPVGRPKGSLSKWSEQRLRRILDIMGGNADAIVKKVCEKALNDNDKDQGMMLKILMDRLVPVQKAVEISHMGGSAINVTVHVDSVEAYSQGRIIEPEH